MSSYRTNLDVAGGFSGLSEHEVEPLWMTVGDTTGLRISLCVDFWGIHLQWTHFNDVQHTGWINQQHAGHVIQFKLFTELKVEFLKVCCMETEGRAVKSLHSDSVPQSCKIPLTKQNPPLCCCCHFTRGKLFTFPEILNCCLAGIKLLLLEELWGCWWLTSHCCPVGSLTGELRGENQPLQHDVLQRQKRNRL